MKPLKIMILVRAVVDSSMPLVHDQLRPDLAAAHWVINPFDEVAMEAAVQLRASMIPPHPMAAEPQLLVVGFADRPGELAVERALAQGGHHALLLEALRPSSLSHPLDSRALALELVALLAQEQPDLLLVGKLAYGQEQGELAALIAGLAGWPLAVACSELSWSATASDRLDFTQRRLDTWHLGSVRLPAVVSVELDVATPRYLSLPSLVAAKRKPKQVQAALSSAPSHPAPVGWSFAAPVKKSVKPLSGMAELVAVIRQREQA